jgi:acetylornithine/succinyldiaminopimelate/putrescine aminotransferase
MAVTINASTSAGLVQTADTTGILQLQTANTAAVTVDASQNVGIGTSSPEKKLHVYRNNTGQDAQVQIEQAGTGSPTLGFLETGVYAWLIGQYGVDNSFRIAPPLCISFKELDEALQIINSALDKIR